MLVRDEHGARRICRALLGAWHPLHLYVCTSLEHPLCEPRPGTCVLPARGPCTDPRVGDRATDDCPGSMGGNGQSYDVDRACASADLDCVPEHSKQQADDV